MSLLKQIEVLESLPLLGSEKRRAIEMADQIALLINPDEQPHLSLRVLIRRFGTQASTPDALARLATAEAWATSEGENHLATQLQLIWCRHVGLTDPEAVPLPLLREAVQQAKSSGTLEAEWRLALATTQPSGMSLREEALVHLQHPGQTHERLRVHLELAEDRENGADTLGSRHHLQQAYDIAMTHQDPDQICTCAMRLGIHYIERGLPEDAVHYLEQGLTVAKSEHQDVRVVVLATLLSTLYLQRKHHEMAAEMAELLLISGARRANWFAVADGHIICSTLYLMKGDIQPSIARLVHAIVNLQRLVPRAVIQVLKGRLAELRQLLSPAVFDPHYESIVEAIEPS